ncbi:UDP-N-acetylmuramoyl-L-alanyl-D-glutamate--2,6-diaminopimelate ligase [Alkalihalophilus marmarensis]|uniref:UDP-N-acetylmuramoyl-L-alanyl-D-glutamate--2, 6-diaminopimelate ligase n=1 Tax=Alkalihalophilus marmarensis TaxID=521377 RepID=UPI002DB7D26B|nr:UDP-N-acetylmuramoyl-L-alanyl-D-glutamate--2,6-diaminopimelate ligase [Alkalihalophilus marmarensis]MEC2073004.1 UDP-N-acetylmuramoyl-L-alanyl-D-glutamate--2,6-diaminopimelate ligase [Alkalihalophilus marmarensis]
MKLSQLTNVLRSYEWKNEGDPEITHIEMDSREVVSGTLFFCIKGYTVDGHDFAKQAVEKGAVALIAEREVKGVEVPTVIVQDTKRTMARLANLFYGDPTSKMNLIGVTGTNGKTTVTHLLEQMMNDADKRTGLIGTMYTKIGDVELKTQNTTPESITLQKRFKEMVDADVDTALMEVSSHALHLGRVRGCDFDIAVFTNLTPDHLDYHETMEAYLFAKGLLFAQLGNRFTEGKVAVLNRDDEATNELLKMTTVDVLTYGVKNKADIMAEDIEITARGTTFTLKAGTESIEIEMKLIGMFSVYNALAAASAAIASDISLEKIKKSLEAVPGVAGRFEPVDAGQDYTVIVDYAHTSDSLENVLTTVREFAKGKISVVVGCGGDRDRTKRPVMAEIATKYADHAIFTSDNPRSEDPKQILDDMTYGLESSNYTVCVDRKEAIYQAINDANKDDILVIAGKGHETYQIIGANTTHFDDREVAKQAIEERV